MTTSRLSLENVTYKIPHGDTILDNLNLDLSAGEFYGLLGHNGSGKTSLMELIIGNKQIAHGKMTVLGEDPHHEDRKEKQHIAFLSQDVTIKGSLSIQDFLRFHSAFYPLYSKEEENHLVELFGVKLDQKVGSLSTGQQKKVQIIAGLATCPKLLLIDEITAVLDPETRELLFTELLRMKNQYGTAILLATNIAEDLIGRADKVLFIENKSGSLHSSDEIQSLFNLRDVA